MLQVFGRESFAQKLLLCCSLFCCVALITHRVLAQAGYTAARAARLQCGAGGLALNNDYRPQGSQGVAVWADYDFSSHLGLEGGVHFGGVRSPDQIGERSYDLGPRLSYRRGRLDGFLTLGLGQGTISNQRYHTASTFNLYEYGMGLDYRASRQINLRLGDVEVQRWLSFPPHGLSPLLVAVGASYVLP